MDNTTSTILMIVVMIFIFYYFLIRPENKKKKDLEKMRNDLKVGDKITTIGGIVGTVCHITDSRIVIETSSDRVRVELRRPWRPRRSWRPASPRRRRACLAAADHTAENRTSSACPILFLVLLRERQA